MDVNSSIERFVDSRSRFEILLIAELNAELSGLFLNIVIMPPMIERDSKKTDALFFLYSQFEVKQEPLMINVYKHRSRKTSLQFSA